MTSVAAYTPVTPGELRRHRGDRRPGVVAFHDSVIYCMGGSVRSGGMVNVRPVRGGRAASLHAVGRAADFMVQPGTGPRAGRTAKQVGDELFVRLVAAASKIGLDEAIWWRQRWTPDLGLRPYRGVAAHRDHVHAGLDPQMADNTSDYHDLCRWFAAAIFGA